MLWHRSLLRLGAGVFIMLLAFACNAQTDEDSVEDESIDRDPESCISLNRLRRLEVIDDRTILFRMSGRTVYRNVLDRSCSSLDRRSQIAYQVRGGRLCTHDVIRVSRSLSSIDPGVVCFLGEFHPVTQEEAEIMVMDAIEGGRGSSRVVMTPIEVPDGEAEDGEGADAQAQDDAAVDPENPDAQQ